MIATHSPRTFVERLDFLTTSGVHTTQVITDLGVLAPDPETRELVLTHVHPGVDVDHVREATGWQLRATDEVTTTEPPTSEELEALRELLAR